jgi:hypothetical protein
MDKVTKTIDSLILMGEEILKTTTTLLYVNYGRFAAWKAKCINFLNSTVDDKNQYFREFIKSVTTNYNNHVNAGIELLKEMKRDIESGEITLKEIDIEKCASLQKQYTETSEENRRNVFVVHGRNLKIRN